MGRRTRRFDRHAGDVANRINLTWTILGVALSLAIAAGFIYAHAIAMPAGHSGLSTTKSASCPTSDIRRHAIDRASATREIAKASDFTQGLIFVNGDLYESTGKVGQSGIYRLNPDGGPRTELLALNKSLFGEGLAKVGDRFYQLTWREGLAFAYTYDAKNQNFSQVATFHRGGEGWGLTDLAGELVLSDGSDMLSFIEPETFAVNRVVPVRVGEQPLRYLNELEAAGGLILANVYGDSRIVGIEPDSGCVSTIIDASALVADMAADLKALQTPVCVGTCSQWDFVLNGIAYDPDQDELYLTGKNWPLILVYRGILG